MIDLARRPGRIWPRNTGRRPGSSSGLSALGSIRRRVGRWSSCSWPPSGYSSGRWPPRSAPRSSTCSRGGSAGHWARWPSWRSSRSGSVRLGRVDPRRLVAVASRGGRDGRRHGRGPVGPLGDEAGGGFADLRHPAAPRGGPGVRRLGLRARQVRGGAADDPRMGAVPLVASLVPGRVPAGGRAPDRRRVDGDPARCWRSGPRPAWASRRSSAC